MPVTNQDADRPMNTLKPQPGQYDSYHPKFHPLPGQWAKDQLSGTSSTKQYGARERHTHTTELQRALAAEKAQHDYWMEWQGMKPGKAIYENPRVWQNTLLPTSKYGTEGRVAS